MSDRKLRELERRWRLSRNAQDETAWLRERLRAGALSQPEVDLAAHLGSRAALATLGHNLTELMIGGGTLLRAKLFDVGDATQNAMRALIAQTRDTIRYGSPILWEAKGVIEASEQWVVSRHEHDCQLVLGAGRRLERAIRDLPRYHHGRLGSVVDCAQELVSCFSAHGWEKDLAQHALNKLGYSSRSSDLKILHDELVPWILGYYDPLAHRVQARGAGA